LKKENRHIKTNLHPRNKNRTQYNFLELIKCCPELNPFVFTNKYGNLSIDYFNPTAVKLLNKALIKFHYQIEWDIPENYLTPALPGRSDYIHYMADLIKDSQDSKTNSIPSNIHFLDIGTGANCIYPIIGACEYGWSSIGSDISQSSIDSAQSILNLNTSLQNKIELRLQTDPNHYFKSIIKEDEYFDFTMCNPPFFSSEIEAKKANSRKQSNLNHNVDTNFNFRGNAYELWYEGGELKFVKQLIHESFLYKTSCYWFSTLISKKENIKALEIVLNKYDPTELKLIQMSQGQKSSRIMAWSFLSTKQKGIWSQTRWE